jgi:hypothetical protein
MCPPVCQPFILFSEICAVAVAVAEGITASVVGGGGDRTEDGDDTGGGPGPG